MHPLFQNISNKQAHVFRSSWLFTGKSLTVDLFSVFATSNIVFVVSILHKIYSVKIISIHININVFIEYGHLHLEYATNLAASREYYNEIALQGRHNECDGVSNHRCLYCLLNRLFIRRSKKTSKLRVIGLCEGNSPVTSEFPSQRASNAENVTILWRHHGISMVLIRRWPATSTQVRIIGTKYWCF